MSSGERATGDLFLKLETARQGPVKGESQDDKHAGEIDLIGWRWGMDAKTAMGGTGPAGKATVNELQIIKQVDKASTAMMSVLRANDVVKKAVLTQRKAGKTPHEYLKITLQEGRLTHYDVRSDETSLVPVEVWNLSFKRINVEYREQLADGQPGGATLYEDSIS
jgi:type VI secretion system secreted protein Hcp